MTRLHVLICGTLVAAASLQAATPKQAQFEVRHELKVKVPEGAKKVRIWFAMPQDDPAQQVKDFIVEAPLAHRIETDSEKNKIVFLEGDPKEKVITIVETFVLTRQETLRTPDATKSRPLNDEEQKTLARYLEPNQHIIIDDKIRALAAQIVGDEANTVRAARKIYDWVLNHIDYWVKDPANKKASPVGSSEYCLMNKTGNCTDFHSLWAALARAKGIPTKLVYGSFFKAELDGKDIDQSYHCWPEFYAGGIGWIPHDVAIADIFAGDFKLTKENETLVSRTTAAGYTAGDAAKVEYYFGNLDERRVTWSVGRDLTLSPKQEGGPINALTKAYVEVDGKVHPEKEGWTRKLTFVERK